jgi:hypothetical protein
MTLLFFRCQCTDGEAKQQRQYDAGGVQQIPAAEGNSKRRRLRSKNKAVEAEAFPELEDAPSVPPLPHPHPQGDVSQRMGQIGQRDQASSSSVSRAIDWRS